MAGEWPLGEAQTRRKSKIGPEGLTIMDNSGLMLHPDAEEVLRKIPSEAYIPSIADIIPSQTDSNGWIKVPKLRVGTGADGSGTFMVYMSCTAQWKHRWKTWAVSFSKGDSSATIGRFAVNFDPIL